MQILNLVSGMAMLQKVNNKEITLDGDTEAFNEAMCEGDTLEDIFGAEFREERACVQGVMPEEYEELVINNLKIFLSLDYDRINLYFGADMFCQVNLLTILGYLDRNNYDGQVALFLVDEQTYDVLKSVAINPKGFYNVYKVVLIDKKFPEIVLPETLLDGIIYYLSYQAGDSPIHEYILNNRGINADVLANEILEHFPEYGLGDSQILRLIANI